MHKENTICDYAAVLSRRPNAVAVICGNDEHTAIRGRVCFYTVNCSVLVSAEIRGLPAGANGCGKRFFAFHIHEGGSCTGNTADPFFDAGMHYNPRNRPHPFHAGDLPPLYGNNGYAFSAFLTGGFSVNEIIGKTVIIHGGIDDFSTQPSGNAGGKIACGVIGKC